MQFAFSRDADEEAKDYNQNPQYFYFQTHQCHDVHSSQEGIVLPTHSIFKALKKIHVGILGVYQSPSGVFNWTPVFDTDRQNIFAENGQFMSLQHIVFWYFASLYS